MTNWILSSSLLIGAVLCIRALGRERLSARLRYALWGLVLLRLLCPVNLGESVLSVQNWLPREVEQTQISETYQPSHTIQMGEMTQMPLMPQTLVEEVRETPTVNWTLLIWAVGAVLVGGAFLGSNVRFWLRLRRSRALVMTETVPVYETAAVETPCLFGFPRAAVYVTPELMEDSFALRHVLAHELTHYRHRDHLWSVLRCVAVTVHWYNPLVWLGAFLSQKDGELACDEGALQRLGSHERNAYARTLLNLTCVGYGGMLTAATSMTGSESDLKTRVLRIVKNPKMPLWAGIVVLIAASIAALALFTGAKTPDLQGVWRLELSYLGEGVSDGAGAYMEYEFGDSRGVRTDCMNGELRSAEWFNYTVDGDTIRIWFDANEEAMEYTYALEGDTLTLRQPNREMTMTAVERKSVPYLPEGCIAPLDVVEGGTGQSADLSAVQTAQLLELLRSGSIIEQKTEQDFPVGDYNYAIIGSGVGLNFAGGVLCKVDADRVEHYVLSNGADIEEFFRNLPWEGRLNENMETSGFAPADMVGITEARMILYGKAFNTASENLGLLEELLSEAVPLGFPAGCPFEGYLEVTLSNGRVLAVVPALDSCAVFQIDGVCYEYGNKFNTDDFSYGNEELLAMFGLDYKVLEELWEAAREPAEGEAIGTNADIGDVVRVKDDVMEPTRLTDERRETMLALLTEGMGEAIGKEAVAFDSLYYTVLFETFGAEEGYVTLSDNGSLYMDGVRYELTTAEAVLQLLDAHYNELRITVGGYDVTELSGVIGEFLYVELCGADADAQVKWSSENEGVCTVTGDAMAAEIYIEKKGVSAISVQWQEDGSYKSDYIVVYGTNP